MKEDEKKLEEHILAESLKLDGMDIDKVNAQAKELQALKSDQEK